MSDFDDKYHEARKASSIKRAQQHQNDFLEVEKFVHSHISSLRLPIGQLEIIDIGCSNGDFSKKFNSLGHVTGVEINKIQALEAKEKIQRVVDELPVEGTFDIVLIRGTLQHLPEEDTFFKFLSRNLAAPTAIVAILSNPNGNSMAYKRTGSLPVLDVSPEFESNFRIYSPASLASKLSSHGILVKRISYPYFATPYSRPFTDFPLGFFSLLMKRRMTRPFPRNMFNLIGIKTEQYPR